MSSHEITEMLRSLTLKDLRMQCRARGINPAGNLEALKQRVADDMIQTGNMSLAQVVETDRVEEDHFSKNNYQRPGGNQNLGNRISSRPTSRVLAPPGGKTQVSIGGDDHVMSPGASAAHVSVEAVLSRMGLGDTDALVAAGKPQQAASSYPAAARAADPAPYNPPSAIMTRAAAARIDDALRDLQLKDLRIQCRVRGLNPAGGQDQLRQRLGQHMLDTSDMTIYPEGSSYQAAAGDGPVQATQVAATDSATNNYARPNGQQNVGNFITDRPSSRVLAPPGGASQIALGGPQPLAGQSTPVRTNPVSSGAVSGGNPVSPAPARTQPGSPGPAAYQSPPPGIYGATTMETKNGVLANNYARPNGQQNLGNFITDRPSSRVLAPPGGKSQISFG